MQTRALSPAYVKHITGQGEPENSEVKDVLCYRLLTVLMATLPGAASQGSLLHFRAIAEHSLKLLFRRRGRVQSLAAKILLRTMVLGKDVIDDLAVDSCREGGLSPPAGTRRSPVSILKMSQVRHPFDFNGLFVLFVVRLLGCCWDPSLLASYGRDFKLGCRTRVWGEYFISKELSDFIAYTPDFIARAIYNSAFPSACSSDADEAALNKIKEFSSILLDFIRGLASHHRWESTVAAVVESIFADAAGCVSRREGWRGFRLIEVLGAATVLGAPTPGVLLGRPVHSAFGRSSGRLVSASSATGQAVVVLEDKRSGGVELVSQQLSELEAPASDEDAVPLQPTTTAACLELASALIPYVRVLCSDLACLSRPESAFAKALHTRCLRPTETLLLQFCVQYLTTAPPAHFYDESSLARLASVSGLGWRLARAPPSFTTDLWQAWSQCSMFCALSLGPVVETAFPPASMERLCTEFVSRDLHLHSDGLREGHGEMLRAGLFVEMIYAASTNSAAFNTPTSVISSEECLGVEPSDNVSGLVMELSGCLRAAIIDLSRQLLLKSVVLGGPSSMDPQCKSLAYDVVALVSNQAAPALKQYARQAMEAIASAAPESGGAVAARLRYTALSLLKPAVGASGAGLLDATDIFSRQVLAARSWIESVWSLSADPQELVGLLRVLLPALPFARNSVVEKSLLLVCLSAVKAVAARIFEGWEMPRDLHELSRVRLLHYRGSM